MLLLATVAAMTLAALFVAEAASGESRRRAQALKRVADYDIHTAATGRVQSSRLRRSGPGVGMLARVALSLPPRRDLDTTRLRLARAGLAHRYTAQSFLAAKTVLGLAGVGLGILFAASSGSIGRLIVFALVLGGGCFALPDFYLSRRLASHLETIEADLPNALDVLAVSVEAGLGLDAAVSMLAQFSSGPLTDELAFTLAEIRMGESRTNAMRRLAERVDVPEMNTFVSAVVSGDRLGIPLSRILRSLAAELRSRRQLKAEERANKMPVKMVLPLGLFIFPALLLVSVGPAVITIVHTLK